MRTADSFEKSLMLGRVEGRRRRGHQRMRGLDGITDAMDIMPGWHHECNGYTVDTNAMNMASLMQTSENGEGQGSLENCSPWDRKNSNTTGRLNMLRSNKHAPEQ